MISDSAKTKIAEWAVATQAVACVWLFGSRARGDHRDDSDFDFSIELMPKAGDTDWAFASYISDINDWKTALQAAVNGEVSVVAFRDDLPMKFEPRGVLLWSRRGQ